MDVKCTREEIKEGLCEYIVHAFCGYNNIELEDAHNHIYESSALAIALEQLGMLSENEKEYAKSRSGILKVFFNQNSDSSAGVKVVTFRDVIDTLNEANTTKTCIDLNEYDDNKFIIEE